MHTNLRRALRACLFIAVEYGSSAVAQDGLPLHPLDNLTTAEYWTAYEVLQQAGHIDLDSFFAGELLREPPKDLVLGWNPGSPKGCEAEVVMLKNGETFEARVDLAARKLVSWRKATDVQAPFLSSEISGMDETIKKDPRVVQALKKRGITDLNTVECVAAPLAYVGIPKQMTRRIGFGSCAEQHGL